MKVPRAKKVATINYSGNVGKTMIAAHMLKPRMDVDRIFSYDTVNIDASADGVDVEKVKGKHFRSMLEELMQVDNAIIDVGAANVEEFLLRMAQFEGSHEEIDFYVVPVVPDRKQQGDTVNTIRALSKMGVPKSKIRLVFNRVDVDESVDEDFHALFGLAKTEKSFVLNPDAVIYASEVFTLLKPLGKTVGDIMADQTNYREQLRQLTDPAQREACARMISIQRAAIPTNRNLDAVFATLFT
jgi:hypothetical protein